MKGSAALLNALEAPPTPSDCFECLGSETEDLKFTCTMVMAISRGELGKIKCDQDSSIGSLKAFVKKRLPAVSFHLCYGAGDRGIILRDEYEKVYTLFEALPKDCKTDCDLVVQVVSCGPTA